MPHHEIYQSRRLLSVYFQNFTMSLSIKNETASIPEPRRGPKGGSTYRIRGVPLDWGKDQLQRHLELHEPDTQPTVKSLADEIDGNFKTATVNFLNPPSSEKTVRPWYIPLPETEESEFAVSSLPLRLDSGFIGMTTLFAPPVEDHEIEYARRSKDLPRTKTMHQCHCCFWAWGTRLRVLQR